MLPRFRAWHKIHKKMYHFVELTSHPDDSVEITIGDSCAKCFTVDTDDVDNVELMQYIGLKDSEGTDIFDGDMLQFEKDGYVYNDEEISVVPVEFEDGGFSPFCVPLGSSDCAGSVYNTCNPKKCKIIGNIYENGGGQRIPSKHHSIVIDMLSIIVSGDNVFTCAECGLDIHLSYDGRYARVLQPTNILSEVSHQILLKTTKE